MRLNRPAVQLVLALFLILLGGFVAWQTQTVGGRVEVRDIRWVTPSGAGMSALLYIPEGVSAENPAPAIVATHGYINSRETQAGFAIEFARRGYVVLAIDQTGHGYSDPPAFARGFGGPDALVYLRSLDFVDRDNIGLEGHSMGGWASGMAAMAYPDDYRAMVLEGSSTGSFGVDPGTPEWPRNVAVVFSEWDEFSPTMWETPVAADIERTDKLKALFGTTTDVVEGRVYGSIEQGTARVLYQPRTNHPGDHLSTAAIANAIHWFQQTLDGGNDLPPENQIWYWKEVGSLIAAVGMILLLFPVGRMLLATRYFSPLIAAAPGSRGARGTGWWLAAAITLLLGPLTFFTFKGLPETIGWTPSALFPQSITNAVIAWTTLLAIITLILFIVWHFMSNRGLENAGDAYGLTWGGRFSGALVGRSLLLASIVVLAGYAALLVTDYLFTVDFRFWVFAIKPMSPLQLRIALVYFIPFTFFFLALNLVLFGQLRRDEWTPGRATSVTIGVLILGWVGLYLIQYVPLLTRGSMAIPDEPLWTIIAYQLLPLMIIAGLLLSFFNRVTGRIYAGAFATSMLVTWIVVASQATHYAF